MQPYFPANPFLNSLTQISFDSKKLQLAFQNLVQKTDFHPINNQISLRYRPTSINPSWHDGTGSLWDSERKMPTATENEFSVLYPDCQDTYFEELQNQVLANTPFQIGRMRLMRIKPRSCYSFHIDTEIRLHFPVITNPQSFLLFQNGFPAHIPIIANPFWVDTRRPHSAMNGHQSEERVHLVLSLIEQAAGQFDQFVKTEISKAKTYDSLNVSP